jgi:hypothetical protein
MKLKYICKDGTKIYLKQGKKSENDFKIYTEFPNQPWPHTLEYIGYCLRLKAWVEKINYPKEKGFRDRFYLHHFVQDCIIRIQDPIETIMKKFKI